MVNVRFFGFRSNDATAETRKPETEHTPQSRFFDMFEQSGSGWFWATDADGRMTYLSEYLADFFGQDRKDLLAPPFSLLFAPNNADTAVRERLPFMLNRQTDFDRLKLNSTHASARRSWEVSGRAKRDNAGNFLGFIGFGVDVTEHLASAESATMLARYDTLTGLPNRLNMSHYLAANIGRGRPGAVLMLDLDRFKAVNDSLGHPAGDSLLKLVAGRLLKIITDKNKIFRLGGDEFQVILPGCTHRERLGEIAHDIISSLSQPYSIDGIRCVIGASVGMAISPDDGDGGEDLMRKADLALYAAKSAGRGCYRYFSDSLLETAENRRQLEEDLRDALARGELELHYQPQVSTGNNNVTGVEALIRWNHPKHGPVSPGIFIPIAEEANLIDAMGEWIIRKACQDAARWPGDIKVAVNVSPIQFANAGLTKIVASALASSGLLPGRLELELTEGVFLSESVQTDTMFANLKALGVRLALDDFGTGYSSLGYLKTAPFDKIKIDQSFVRGATRPGSRNGAIIAAIVALAGALDMETTAEGIETFDQLELMRDLGVSHVQGYVYSKPIDNATLNQMLGDGTWAITPAGPARHRSTRRSMYRKAAIILSGYCYPVLVRNLSESGAFIEGQIDVPVGTQLILDLGEGQLEVASVRRAGDRGCGIAFARPLIDDGAGGLTISQRVAPYLIAKYGLIGAAQTEKPRPWHSLGMDNVDMLATQLGLMLPELETGQSMAGADGMAHMRVRSLFAASSPLQDMALVNNGMSNNNAMQLSPEEWERLKRAVIDSPNPQLKNIIALVVLAGVRFQELLTATWDDISLEKSVWTIPASRSGDPREIHLPEAAVAVLAALPRAPSCNYVIINPRTKKPYNSIYGGWDSARKKAGLDNLSIHDLRKNLKLTW